METSVFAGFEYRGLSNLGDNIQSIATERLLPDITQRFDRDTLAMANPSVPMYIVMNGWFSHQPQTCLPQFKNLQPIFWGFHITDWNDSWNYFSRREVADYLKRYEPIGCRDPYTAERLSKLGIKTFVSYCLTLTFPKRKQIPEDGKVFVVDFPQNSLPEALKRNFVYCSHYTPFKDREDVKRFYAEQLLQIYQNKARLIVTTRLHCLLPCVAMGIPVVFFNNPDDYRISWVKDLGIKINTLKKIDETDWSPHLIDMEGLKSELVKRFLNKVSMQIDNHSSYR